MEFKHPNYYKNLRKLYRSRNRDQAISKEPSTDGNQRTPGTGLKQQASSDKQQATSYKASSFKRQASSPKLQASSFKPQATSSSINFPS